MFTTTHSHDDAPLASLFRLVWIALCAALIAGGAFVSVPIGPVPVSLQTFCIMLAGFVLGPRDAGAATLLYLLAGSLGLPVFAGGAGGFAHLLGPTGGFLAGFFFLAVCCGFGRSTHASGQTSGLRAWVRPVLAGFAGLAVLYAIGLTQLAVVLNVGFSKALALGFVPFWPGALAKLALAVIVAHLLARRGLLPR